MNSNNQNTFKVTLVGDGAVGKTAFVKRQITGEFEKRYIPTLGLEVHPIQYNTSEGEVTVDFWDTAGQEKFSGLGDAYWLETKLFLIFFDLNARITFKNAKKNILKVKTNFPKTPCVLVGNKCDLKSNVCVDTAKAFAKAADMPFFELSVKLAETNDSLVRHILRELTGDENLTV